MEFESQIKNNQILVFVMPEENYADKMTDLMKFLDRMSDRICYVSLNKPYKAIEKMIDDNKMNKNKFFFIDGVTCISGKPEDRKNCFFLSAPGDLTGLSIMISRVLDGIKPTCVVFDSLSTLLLYKKPAMVARFAQNISTKIRAYEYCKGILTSMKDNTDDFVMKELDMFTDRVVHL